MPHSFQLKNCVFCPLTRYFFLAAPRTGWTHKPLSVSAIHNIIPHEQGYTAYPARDCKRLTQRGRSL